MQSSVAFIGGVCEVTSFFFLSGRAHPTANLVKLMYPSTSLQEVRRKKRKQGTFCLARALFLFVVPVACLILVSR